MQQAQQLCYAVKCSECSALTLCGMLATMLMGRLQETISLKVWSAASWHDSNLADLKWQAATCIGQRHTATLHPLRTPPARTVSIVEPIYPIVSIAGMALWLMCHHLNIR